MSNVTLHFPSRADAEDYLHQLRTSHHYASKTLNDNRLTGRFSEAEIELAVNGYGASVHHQDE